MSSNTTNSISRAEMIKWIITVVLAAVFLLVPEQGIYTSQVKMFMAITVGALALAAFELVPILFISILMPALWVLFKVAPVAVIMSPWVGTTMIMIFGAYFMAASLERSGLLRRIAFYLMCKVKGNYFVLLLSIMCVGIVMNILTAGRGYLIMAALGVGLCMSLNCMEKKLGAGIASAIMLGACTSHAYTYQVSGWSIIMKMAEGYIGPTDVTPLSIILHNWPLFFVSLFILFITAKMFKPEEGLGEIVYFKEQLKNMGPVTRVEKANAIMLVILLVYIFTVQIHKLDINLGFAIIPFMVYLPFVNGADSDAIKDVNYSVILFVAACMGIGTVASNLGLGVALMEVCGTLLHGSTNPIALMGIVFTIVFGLNFLMTPAAIIALIIEPIILLATSMGYSAVPFAYAVNACSEAIIFPYEYVPYLVVYAFGMISMKDFIKYNIMRSVLFFIGFLVVLVPYWMLIGLL